MSDHLPTFMPGTRLRIMQVMHMERQGLANLLGRVVTVRTDTGGEPIYGLRLDNGDRITLAGSSLMQVTPAQESRWKAAKGAKS